MIDFRCRPAHIWEEELKGSTEGETWLSVNATCAYGNCELDKKQDKVKCKKRQDVDVMDIVHSVWSYLQPSRFSTFAKNNIVGAVMIFSAIFWVIQNMQTPKPFLGVGFSAEKCVGTIMIYRKCSPNSPFLKILIPKNTFGKHSLSIN